MIEAGSGSSALEILRDVGDAVGIAILLFLAWREGLAYRTRTHGTAELNMLKEEFARHHDLSREMLSQIRDSTRQLATLAGQREPARHGTGEQEGDR